MSTIENKGTIDPDNSVVPTRLDITQGSKEAVSTTYPNTTQGLKGAVAPLEVSISAADREVFFGQKLPDATIDALRFTDVSIYSVTPYAQSLYTANALLSYFKQDVLKNMTLLDASACIGGNTWSFAKLTKHVTAVEIDPLHAEILASNMAVLGVQNTSVVCGDFGKSISNGSITQDIVFIDPPWGGIDYKKEVGIKLGYAIRGKWLFLNEVCRMLPDVVKLVVMKLPFNHDTDGFDSIHHKFRHREIVVIRDPKGKPLYMLVFLSKTAPFAYIVPAVFPRIGCRYMKTTPINRTVSADVTLSDIAAP
jgi:hypothetical protein